MLAEALTAACVEPLPSQGGYFVVGDVSNLLELMPDEYRDGSVAADWAFCRWLATEHGVVAIPSSPFFTDEPSRPHGRRFMRSASRTRSWGRGGAAEGARGPVPRF